MPRRADVGVRLTDTPMEGVPVLVPRRSRDLLTARALAEHELAAARPAQQPAVARDDLATREGHAGDAAHGEAVERIVAGARVERALIDGLRRCGIEDQQICVAPDRDRPLLRIESEELCGCRRER